MSLQTRLAELERKHRQLEDIDRPGGGEPVLERSQRGRDEAEEVATEG